MSERPGPSPEELSSPEEAVYKDIYSVVERIITRHPKGRGIQGDRPQNNVMVDNVGEYSYVNLSTFGEGESEATISFNRPDSVEVYSLKGGKIEQANYEHQDKGTVEVGGKDDLNLDERMELGGVVAKIEQALQERGEIS